MTLITDEEQPVIDGARAHGRMSTEAFASCRHCEVEWCPSDLPCFCCGRARA